MAMSNLLRRTFTGGAYFLEYFVGPTRRPIRLEYIPSSFRPLETFILLRGPLKWALFLLLYGPMWLLFRLIDFIWFSFLMGLLSRNAKSCRIN